MRTFAAMVVLTTVCVGGVPTQHALAQQPAAGDPTGAQTSIQRQVLWRAAGVTTLSLSNGVDVHLRAMPRPGSGKVMISVFVPGIELDETAQTRGTAMLAVEALRLAAGDVKLRAFQRPEGLLITGTCPADKAAAGLRQIAATLSEPTLDRAAFDEAKTKAAAALARSADKPDALAVDALLNAVTPADDARLRRPTALEVQSVTLESAQRFIRRLTASRAIDVSVVGDVNISALSGPVVEALGPLPARTRDRLTTLRTAKPPELQQRSLSIEGPRPLLTVALPAPGIEQLTDARLAILAAALLQRRVEDALRADGLTINAASSDAVTGRTYPGMGMVVATFSLSGEADRLARAAAIARASIAKLVDAGPTSAELKRAVDAAVKDIEPRLDTAEYWSHGMPMAWFLGLSIDELGSAPGTLKQATRQTVRQHMERWWGDAGQRAITVTVTPPTPAPSR